MRRISLTSKISLKTSSAESLVGAYRAESKDRWTASSGITVKIPPLFDGSTSWFKYEELIHDWLDLTQLETEKRGPALKNRLIGDAAMYTGLLDRESLSRRWIQVFQEHCEQLLLLANPLPKPDRESRTSLKTGLKDSDLDGVRTGFFETPWTNTIHLVGQDHGKCSIPGTKRVASNATRLTLRGRFFAGGRLI